MIEKDEWERKRENREDPFMLVPRPADSLTPPIHLASEGFCILDFLGETLARWQALESRK